MVLYEYRCDEDGDIEVFFPMGTAPAAVRCEVCGSSARRVFTKPMMPHPKQDIIAAIDNAQKSAHEPAVVKSIPTSGQKRPPHFANDPRQYKLPRP